MSNFFFAHPLPDDILIKLSKTILNSNNSNLPYDFYSWVLTSSDIKRSLLKEPFYDVPSKIAQKRREKSNEIGNFYAFGLNTVCIIGNHEMVECQDLSVKSNRKKHTDLGPVISIKGMNSVFCVIKKSDHTVACWKEMDFN